MSASEPVTPDEPHRAAMPADGALTHAAPTPAAPTAASAAAAKREARRTDAGSRITGVIVVGMSIAVWWPAFTLGAWGDFFFDQMLTVWAASVGALIVVLIQPRGKPRVGRAIALLIPSLWLVLSFLTVTADPDDVVALIVTLLGIVVGILGVPATIWVLVRMIWPEFAEDISWGRRFAVIGAVLVIAVASFLLGVYQSKFLTCQDFTVSGNSEPAGCTPEQP
ncbi:hypothetical protein [Herbiconiux sp. UC225_62]|uniref:hypothetical protein n=1 Tax=Herbiconiux sp. UC225_62 TaxID=3350168 RepID=UPI0036D38BE7